jgi:hypothetical protein
VLKNSVQDKLDETFIETALFSLWKIDLINFVRTKASLSKSFHIQPTEVDKMPMWEYELFLTYLNELVKEENDQQQSEMDKYHVDDYMKMANPSNMKKLTNPDIGNIKMPSIPNMPR